MFETYLLPVEAAVSLFPLITALIMVPVAIRGYRRRGRAGGWSALVFYSFVFYLLAALLQTVMPLPADTSAHCSAVRYAASPQLEPFAFYSTVSTAAGGDWDPATLFVLTPTWTTLLNVALLFPLGIYLRYLLRQNLLPATVLAFTVSLFFETTQYTGLWFVYDCPYRQFNVDDLLLNTGGAVLGWLVAGPLLRLLPANDPDRERSRYGDRVSVIRRALAFLTDLAGWLITWTLTTGLIAVGTDWPTGRQYALPIGTALGVLWFWLLPAVFASTPGKRAVLLRIARPDGSRAGPVRITLRTWMLHSPLAVGWLAVAEHVGAVSVPDPVGPLLPYAAVLAATVVWGWSPMAVLPHRDRTAPYERWSGTANLAVPGRRDRVPSVPAQDGPADGPDSSAEADVPAGPQER